MANLRSVGVEEELLLFDSASGTPAAAGEQVLMAWNSATASRTGFRSGEPRLVAEVKQEQIELVGPPLVRHEDVEAAIRLGRRRLDEAALAVGVRAVPLATSPVPVRPHLTESVRYGRMAERFAVTLEQQLTCGFHIHVAVAGPDEGVAVLDRIRAWLPMLLALSANSPFWGGRDTGFSSYRYQAWSRWPTSGPSPVFGHAEVYRERVAAMLTSGVLLDAGMIYFDARLSDAHPTVEVRIADVCQDPAHAAMLAVLTRALVETAARQWQAGLAPDDVPAELLRLWTWQASRFGVEGELVDPTTRTPRPAGDALAGLLSFVGPVLEEAGELTSVEDTVASILRDGTGARRQRLARALHGSPEGAVRDAMRQPPSTARLGA
ncbi:carboxylate-amine ligase [Sinomonas gamaensis]|uniref:carboxylate-amine ligase n=1 Tax=Sinomonas gamaensis TaxID=2565624 RepID=UPI001BB2CCB3|nr:glutamate--cysteine ligase [Sinomonas gamaensis]